jgi:hypothetical protein
MDKMYETVFIILIECMDRMYETVFIILIECMDRMYETVFIILKFFNRAYTRFYTKN